MKKITIKFNIGSVKAITDRDYFPRGKCERCKESVYFVKAIGMKKFMANLLADGSYIIHNLVCEKFFNKNKT